MRSAHHHPHPIGRPFQAIRSVTLALSVVLAWTWNSSCVAAGADVHLAPFYTRTATADGRRQHEALFGFFNRHDDLESGRVADVTLGPLWGIDYKENDDYFATFLVPLGYASKRGDQGSSALYPVYLWSRLTRKDGSREWRLVTIPGAIVRSNEERGTEFGLFPLYGRFEDFITFDEIYFVLWPLYVHAEREGRVSDHVLYPFFGWTLGGGETSYHVFPLFAQAKIEGKYERYYALWPIFHYNRNLIESGTPEKAWMVFPLVGRARRGEYRATTVIWPLFGYAADPTIGFWALDAPFPLIRIQRGPEDTTRTRFWPFYSHLYSDGLETTSFLWPFIHIRSEEYLDAERDSVYVIPLWQSFERTQLDTGEKTKWRKLFPFYQWERRDEWRRGSFPTLDPFPRYKPVDGKSGLIDRHYAWMWKAWEWETDGQRRRERSLFGLWKRERSLAEDRRSLSGLWSSRRYREGERVIKERSLLFGLLRWRVTEEDGFDMLPVAFPGPGWPAQHVEAIAATREQEPER